MLPWNEMLLRPKTQRVQCGRSLAGGFLMRASGSLVLTALQILTVLNIPSYADTTRRTPMKLKVRIVDAPNHNLMADRFGTMKANMQYATPVIMMKYWSLIAVSLNARFISCT